MKKVKPFMVALSAVLAASFLAACEQPAAPGTATAQTAAPAAEVISEPTAAPALPLRILQTAEGGLSAGKDGAYLYDYVNDSDAMVATAIDFSDGVQRVLCDKPGCTHSDESCPAWVYTFDPHGWGAEFALFCDGDTLYWVKDGRFIENQFDPTAEAFIDASNLDGSNRRRIVSGTDIPDLHSAFNDDVLADDNAIYFIKRNYGEGLQGETDLYRLDKGTNVFTTVHLGSGPDGAPLYMAGVWRDKLIMQQVSTLIPLERPTGDATEEEWATYETGVREGQKTQGNEIIAVATDGTRSGPLAAWVAEELLGSAVGTDDGWYSVRAGSGDLERTDLLTGEQTTLAPALAPGARSVRIYPVARNKLLVDATAPETFNESRFVVDPAGGETRALDATWSKLGSTSARVPFIYANNGTSLLMQVATLPYMAHTIDQDGVEQTYQSEKVQLAVLPLADYLGGSTDWTNCTFIGRFNT